MTFDFDESSERKSVDLSIRRTMSIGEADIYKKEKELVKTIKVRSIYSF